MLIAQLPITFTLNETTPWFIVALIGVIIAAYAFIRGAFMVKKQEEITMQTTNESIVSSNTSLAETIQKMANDQMNSGANRDAAITELTTAVKAFVGATDKRFIALEEVITKQSSYLELQFAALNNKIDGLTHPVSKIVLFSSDKKEIWKSPSVKELINHSDFKSFLNEITDDVDIFTKKCDIGKLVYSKVNDSLFLVIIN